MKEISSDALIAAIEFMLNGMTDEQLKTLDDDLRVMLMSQERMKYNPFLKSGGKFLRVLISATQDIRSQHDHT